MVTGIDSPRLTAASRLAWSKVDWTRPAAEIARTFTDYELTYVADGVTY